jgi:hypothetical protein
VNTLLKIKKLKYSLKMRKHTKIYCDYFGYDESDFIPSELSGRRANDIHHIECKGMGGNPSGDKDVIENLMALTRQEHEKYGDKAEFMEWLKERHYKFMERKGVFFQKITKPVADGNG